MQYEIINPSDECFVHAYGERADRVACIAALLLGNGMYGLTNEADETVMPIIFNGYREWFQEQFGEGAEPFMLANLIEIADCLKTFHYAGERSSLNDIGACAKANEEWLRKVAERAGVAA